MLGGAWEEAGRDARRSQGGGGEEPGREPGRSLQGRLGGASEKP